MSPRFPERRSPEHFKLSGTVEVVAGAVCYTLGFLAAGATIVMEAGSHLAGQNVSYMVSTLPQAAAGATLSVASGVFLNRMGVEHLGEAEAMANKRA